MRPGLEARLSGVVGDGGHAGHAGVESIGLGELLRTMGMLIARTEAVVACVEKQLRPTLDQQVAVVLCVCIKVRVHGDGDVQGDVRTCAMNKDIGGIAPQLVLGVVQMRRGCH